MKRPDKRKLVVDWKEKNGNDSERISKRLEGRSLLENAATTKNDSKPKTAPAAPRKGAPLLKLRKKIRDIYDEDEDEEDEVTAPFFNITLIDENEEERNKEQEETERLIRITKQQQMAGKLNILMDTATTAKQLGIDDTNSKRAAQQTTEHEMDAAQQKAYKQMISELSEEKSLNNEREQAALAMKQSHKERSSDSQKNIPAQNIERLAEAPAEEEVAELILKKSGRKRPKKSLVEIAKEINRYEQYEQEQINLKKGKENEQ